MFLLWQQSLQRTSRSPLPKRFRSRKDLQSLHQIWLAANSSRTVSSVSPYLPIMRGARSWPPQSSLTASLHLPCDPSLAYPALHSFKTYFWNLLEVLRSQINHCGLPKRPLSGAPRRGKNHGRCYKPIRRPPAGRCGRSGFEPRDTASIRSRRQSQPVLRRQAEQFTARHAIHCPGADIHFQPSLL